MLSMKLRSTKMENSRVTKIFFKILLCIKFIMNYVLVWYFQKTRFYNTVQNLQYTKEKKI